MPNQALRSDSIIWTTSHTLEGCWDDRSVYLDGSYLHPVPSQNLINHSPDGFNWGYGGSGPAQLALAVLLAITDKEEALANYQAFKENFIARLPQADFKKKFNLRDILGGK